MDAFCMRQKGGNPHLTVHDCLPDDGMNQLFVYEDNRLKWCADKSYVFDVWEGRAENGTEVRLHKALPPDHASVGNQRFELDTDGRILWKTHPTFCLDPLFGDTSNGSSRILIHEKLPPGDASERNQIWTFISVK